MSAQVERPYRTPSDSLTIQDTLKMKTPLSGSLSYYQQHIRLLDRNAEELRALFPHNSKEHIKELLEELDNNMQMAKEILKQESNNVATHEEQANSPHREEHDSEALALEKAKTTEVSK